MISAMSPKKCIPAICLGVIELVNIKMSNSISVVIPYFNDSPVIERCLNSVFKQTHRPNQIIIVDDCSDDSSVLRDIVANMPSGIEIILHRNDENKNGAYSRNYGVRIANGDYIAFLDGDDYWLERHLELSLNMAMETEADFVYSNIVWCNQHGQLKNHKTDDVNKYKNKFDIVFFSPPQTNSFFFKKAIYKTVSFNESLRRHQDYQFFLDVIKADFNCQYGNFFSACYCLSHRNLLTRINVDSMCVFWDEYGEYFSNRLLNKKIISLCSLFMRCNMDLISIQERYSLFKKINDQMTYSFYLKFKDLFPKKIFSFLFLIDYKIHLIYYRLLFKR